jgi:hypothetical protein
LKRLSEEYKNAKPRDFTFCGQCKEILVNDLAYVMGALFRCPNADCNEILYSGFKTMKEAQQILNWLNRKEKIERGL